MTQKTQWIQAVKDRYSLESIAFQIGMKTSGKYFGPCPCCNAERRGNPDKPNSDKRPPISFFKVGGSETRWQCFACGTKGDIIDMVSYHLHGVKGSVVGDFKEIKEFFKTNEFADVRVITKEKSNIPQKDINNLWSNVVQFPVSETMRNDVREFFLKRGIDYASLDEAFVFSNSFKYNSLTKVLTSQGRYMPFWPFRWANEYPVAIPLYDANAKLCSFQGRRIKMEEGKMKSMCPVGFSMDGLFFADTNMRRFLLGEHNSSRFWILEGEMDFLALVSDKNLCGEPKLRAEPVMAIKNGSFSAFDHIRFPTGADIIIATHNDEAGNKYAEKIAEKIAPLKPKRILLDEGFDVNDFLAIELYCPSFFGSLLLNRSGGIFHTLTFFLPCHFWPLGLSPIWMSTSPTLLDAFRSCFIIGIFRTSSRIVLTEISKIFSA